MRLSKILILLIRICLHITLYTLYQILIARMQGFEP